jgi:hypothetical protein
MDKRLAQGFGACKLAPPLSSNDVKTFDIKNMNEKSFEL